MAEGLLLSCSGAMIFGRPLDDAFWVCGSVHCLHSWCPLPSVM